jgi:hypothetical protein
VIIQSLDQERRLWSVTDLLRPEQVQHILDLDWINLVARVGNLPHRLSIETNQLSDVERWFSDLLPRINSELNTKFTKIFGQWWLDRGGFHCPLHTDGHLPNSIQMYWAAPGEQYGTGFYHYKDKRTLKHQFLSRANTGYIMLNHANPDGSQPLQWHAMLNTVPQGAWRLSSYHIMEL